MVEKGYFIDGEARNTGAEIVPEPDSDEAAVYPVFLSLACTCLCIPL
jgi:hypothetical protein